MADTTNINKESNDQNSLNKKHSFFGGSINIHTKDFLDLSHNTQEEINQLDQAIEGENTEEWKSETKEGEVQHDNKEEYQGENVSQQESLEQENGDKTEIIDSEDLFTKEQETEIVEPKVNEEEKVVVENANATESNTDNNSEISNSEDSKIETSEEKAEKKEDSNNLNSNFFDPFESSIDNDDIFDPFGLDDEEENTEEIKFETKESESQPDNKEELFDPFSVDTENEDNPVNIEQNDQPNEEDNDIFDPFGLDDEEDTENSTSKNTQSQPEITTSEEKSDIEEETEENTNSNETFNEDPIETDSKDNSDEIEENNSEDDDILNDIFEFNAEENQEKNSDTKIEENNNSKATYEEIINNEKIKDTSDESEENNFNEKDNFDNEEIIEETEEYEITDEDPEESSNETDKIINDIDTENITATATEESNSETTINEESDLSKVSTNNIISEKDYKYIDEEKPTIKSTSEESSVEEDKAITDEELFEQEKTPIADDEISQQFFNLVKICRQIFNVEYKLNNNEGSFFKIIGGKSENYLLEYNFYLIEEDNITDLFIKKISTTNDIEDEHLVQFSYHLEHQNLDIFVDEVILYNQINKADSESQPYNDTKSILEKFTFLTQTYYNDIKAKRDHIRSEQEKKKNLQQIFKGF